ncbi:MAG TPA: hypothetical protein VFS22_10680 [Flavisolibacter sp.]|nr:hypothetical protein [Flavisolibacter sp.]
MKKIFIIAAASFLFASSAFAADPSQKVLDAFSKTFKQVKDVTWQDVDENRYEANFNQNNITYRVMYDQEGNVLKSIRYYYAQTLPIFIQAKLAKKYDGKKVFGVTEVTTETDIQYHIILEDATNWTHVQSDAYGNMFTEKKLKKA